MNFGILIDEDRCKRCGICSEVCPESVFEKDSLTDKIYVKRADLCITCGHCVFYCPEEAVNHSLFPYEKMEPLGREILFSRDRIMSLFQTRRSVRAYSEKSVSAEDIEYVVQCSKMAPTAHNHKEVNILIIKDREEKETIRNAAVEYFQRVNSMLRVSLLRKILGFFAPYMVQDAPELLGDFKMLLEKTREKENVITRNAYALMIFHADRRLSLSDVDCNLAAQNAMLAAHGIGIGSFYMGYVVAAAKHSKKIRKLLSIPKHHQIYAAIGLGVPRYKPVRQNILE